VIPPASTGAPAEKPADENRVARDSLSLLASAMLGLRSTGDPATACAIAGDSARSALGASDYKLLRLEPRSGALRCLEPTGEETRYLPEPGGPVEWVMRHEQAIFDEGEDGAAPRESGLWTAPPAALATVPLISGGAAVGLMLVAFAAPRPFGSATRTLLQTLGDALGLALERSWLRRELDEMRRSVQTLEKQRRDGEQASSALMSVVAHEIRSPLTAIKAYTEAMLDHLTNPHAPRERFLGIINSECDRLARLVSDVLDLSRLEAGQRPLRLARFDLERLVKETLEGLMPSAMERKITLTPQLEEGLVVEADPDLVRRLLINLAGNAIKYSPLAGTVRVVTRSSGDECLCEIEDQGPGIPPEDLPHVFERFYRARRQRDEEVEGTGLGLAISHGIVELHGGRIWAQSLEPHGTRLCVALPRRQLAAPRARRMARRIWGRADLRELCDGTVDMVAASMDAEIVSLMLVDPDHGDLFIAAWRGLDGEKLQGRRTAVRAGVAGSVAAWGRPLLVNDIETDRRFSRLNHPQYTTKSLLCVPLCVEDEVVGVINVNNKISGEPFDDDDLAVLSALVERVGSAVERAIAHPESPRVVGEALEAVRAVTQLRRDGLLGGRNRAHLARATARQMGMSETEVDLVGYVASIHDVGMTRLQGAVNRPGKLDAVSRKEIQRHPENTIEMIRGLEYASAVRDVILSHHEHWDGSGYPRGLAGTDIPPGARILAVVDAWESMTRGRPYRPPLVRGQAIEELRRNAGRHFDPEVIEAFVRALAREEN
jgi:signal transduction histidine kinase/putative methionine-R-sulfoxide reductase with GAF domain